MSRTYSDPSYGSKKSIELLDTAALNGTAAAATDQVYTVMAPITVTDWNVRVTTAGSGTLRNVILGKSLGGTGTVTAIGTIAVGTASADTVKDGTVTSTSLVAGDDLVVQIAGTGATVAVVAPVVQYVEKFVVSDS